MLQLRPEHIDALEQGTEAEFHRRLAARYRETAPSIVAGWKGLVLEKVIAESLRHGRAFGGGWKATGERIAALHGAADRPARIGHPAPRRRRLHPLPHHPPMRYRQQRTWRSIDVDAWRPVMKSVREVLNPVLLSIAPERGAFEAARAMAERRVHHLLVMRRGDLLGVVCSCDVKHVPRRTPVEQVMSRRLLTFPIDGSVEDAVSTMLNEHIGFLPVIEQGGVIGVITRGDLARALGPEHETSQMLACKWCQSHRHVNFTPKYAAPICDDCLADDPHDVGEGD